VSGTTPLDYREWRTSALGAITERLERAAVFELAGPVRGLRVVDVGCGDGAYARAAAQAGAQVVGIDRAEAPLRAVHAGPGDPEVHLAVAEAAQLPFRDCTFDVVLAVTVLCFVPHPERAIAEMVRVLQPGGTLILAELGCWSTWAMWRRVRAWFGPSVWARARFRSSRELAALMSAQGLVVERVRGAAFYPPVAALARWLSPADPLLGRFTTMGAAFVALRGTKARAAP
jgi:2-polyprenyl-3-methyl-5-hydroxy-6-metoxy-1,4-benzoquinol methylase